MNRIYKPKGVAEITTDLVRYKVTNEMDFISPGESFWKFIFL